MSRPDFPFYMAHPQNDSQERDVFIKDELDLTTYENLGYNISTSNKGGGSRRRRVRPSRKYKKSAKRVFRKKSRSTRRR